MDDSQCILLDFHNENNKIAVGFRDWLDPPLTDDNLINIIDRKETIVIMWPSCNVEPASKMIKRVEHCKWKKCVATILAAGGWVEMNEKASNMVILNVLESTKSTRKLLKKKDLRNDGFYYGKENKKKGQTAKKNVKKVKRAACEKIDSNSQLDFLKELELAQARKIQMSDDEMSDSSDTSAKRVQQDKLDFLMAKMQKLEEENAKMRSLLNKEDNQKSKVNLETTVSPSTSNNSGNAEVDNSNATVEFDIGITSKNSKDNPDPIVLPSTSGGNGNSMGEIDEEIVEESLQEISRQMQPLNTISSNDTLRLDEIADLDEIFEREEEINNSPGQQIVMDSTVPVLNAPQIRPQEIRVIAYNKLPKHVGKLKERIVIIGGREYSYSKVACCNRASVSKYTMELAVIVFDQDELSTCSLTGQVPNFHKNNPNILAKKQLCPVRVQGMLDYVLSVFGDTTDNRILFHNGLRKKLNNVSRNKKQS